MFAPVASALIRPNEADPNVEFGFAKLTLLNALKMSMWSSSLAVFASGTVFASDRSVCTHFGPRSTLRGALPNVYCAGIANADASKQLIWFFVLASVVQLSDG